jgi:formate dehydrogenase subunit beta
LVPLRTPETDEIKIHLIDTPEQLEFADPFAPIMPLNAATLVAELTQEYPYNRFAAVLRPCELRALVEMVKLDSFNLERVFLIGIECLSTFPEQDFQWRAERKNGSENLTNEILMFARQGGLVESRYRLACQMCEAPTPAVYDLKISLLGLPVREVVLVSTECAASSEALNLKKITSGEASPELISSNKQTLKRIHEKRTQTRIQVTASLEATLPRNVNELIHWLEDCKECQVCMEACPICSYVFPERQIKGRYLREDVIKWLISCADCGMCAQACPDELPIAALYGNIRRELARAYGYESGQSLDVLPPV